MSQIKNAREAAFLALLNYEKSRTLIEDFFRQFDKQLLLGIKDLKLAKEIAFGSMRRDLSLDFFAKTLVKKLNLKPNEKIFLKIALYQYIFMDKIPLYAIVNETMILVKKYCRKQIGPFFNAILRKLSEKKFLLPTKNSLSDLSVYYSYPSYFIELLIKEYGLEEAKKLLGVQNTIFPPMVRERLDSKVLKEAKKELVYENKFKVFSLLEPSIIPLLAADPAVYIQNATPSYLMEKLSENFKNPKNVLDFCASPGGKLIAVHDLYSEAALFANDVSEEKIKVLKSNLDKYGIKASISISTAQNFSSSLKFDLIVVDAPCSNSGVLHKRAEARWRLTHESLTALEVKQKEILKNAINFLAPNGQIWYLTCSILNRENENMIEYLAEEFNLSLVNKPFKVLPNENGWDGGFSAAFIKKA